jgi:hypothetical protein
MAPPTTKFFAALAALALLLATAAHAQGSPASSSSGGSSSSAPASTGAGGGEAVTAENCRARFESAGGESAIVSRAPACSAAATSASGSVPSSSGSNPAASATPDLAKCCDQLKAQFNDPFIAKCACLPPVWTEARKRIIGSGLTGVTAETVDAFVQSCGIKVAGLGC